MDQPERPRELDAAVVSEHVKRLAPSQLGMDSVQFALTDPESQERKFYERGKSDKARGLPALDPKYRRWLAEDLRIRDEEVIRRCIEAYELGHRGEPIRIPFLHA